ncbi:hypothetical protein VU602_20435, partial [Providencia stuartii]|uniref:hypothetical protein n=1 Tax=Providencia stuartii TaxID=588 RepID=UPI003CF3E158
TTLSGSVEQQATQVSGVQTTFGGVCGAKKGGLALHFGLESANRRNNNRVTNYHSIIGGDANNELVCFLLEHNN